VKRKFPRKANWYTNEKVEEILLISFKKIFLGPKASQNDEV